MSSWLEDIEHNYSVIDKIDILPYLKPGAEVDDIMDQMETDYEPLAKDDPILEGYLFNLITTEEFAEYLEARYPDLLIRTWTTSHTYYKIEGFGDGT